MMNRVMMLVGAAAVALTAGQAMADGDAAKGEKVFRKCAACHAVGEGAKNKVGPELNGIVGRKVASVEDYKYSKAMTSFGEEHPEWTDELLHSYLEKPRNVVKGTKMAFAGLRKESERDDVIAYLEQFNADGTAK
ncbi:MAG: cytochrome c family protein [Stappia sp.]|uniref:c-type cytochrome n=1 Tax=Stappia sp. TaxID=1870903 RepID=UPI000C55F7BB|nr:cytochrome c family protein [Stappia sp.]MBM21121.1 cytochrome c family protein [Stappia sp.]